MDVYQPSLFGEDHSEEIERAKNERVKASAKKAGAKRNKSEKGKAWQKAYKRSKHGKSKAKIYREKPEAKARMDAYMKDYLLRPGIKDKKKAYGNAYMRSDRAKTLAKASRQKPERKANKRAYTKTTKGAIVERNHWSLRRALKKTNGPYDPKIDWTLLSRRDHDRCGWCGEGLRGDISLDHIVPLSKGGPHTHDNFQLVHKSCNSQKGAKVA